MEQFVPRFQYKNLSDHWLKLTNVDDFYGNSLEVHTPKGLHLAEIGDFALTGLGFQTVNLPDTVTTVGGAAFARNNLSAFRSPERLTKIDNRAFWYNHLRSIEFPRNVKIAGNAFDYQEIWYSDFKTPHQLQSFKPTEMVTIYVAGKQLTTDDVRAELDPTMVDFEKIEAGQRGVPSFEIADGGRIIKPITGVDINDDGFLKIGGYFNLKVLPLNLTIRHIYLNFEAE